jgi:hypothetical protein
VQDFGCFLNKFANGDTYANCDNSTIPPILNVQDFGCFLNKFANGCSNLLIGTGQIETLCPGAPRAPGVLFFFFFGATSPFYHWPL